MVRQCSLLWEFNNGNSGSGYLFGSIHINTEFVHSLLASLEPYIKGVDIVATEIHLDEVHQNLNPKYFSLPSGNSYQDYWLTTPVEEILEDTENYVKFRTKNTVYEWKR